MTVIRYSLLRTMLLFACMLAIYLLGVRDPVLLIALTGVSSIALSYFLLKGPREQMARQIAERAGRRLPNPPADHVDRVDRVRQFDKDADIEDREDDARRDP